MDLAVVNAMRVPKCGAVVCVTCTTLSNTLVQSVWVGTWICVEGHYRQKKQIHWIIQGTEGYMYILLKHPIEIIAGVIFFH